MERSLKEVFKDLDGHDLQMLVINASVRFGMGTVKTFDENVKKLVAEAFTQIEDQETEEILRSNICKMIISISKAFNKEMSEIFKIVIEKMQGEEPIHCKPQLVPMLLEYLFYCSTIGEIPSEKVYTNLCEQIFNLAKSFVVNKEEMYLFDQKVSDDLIKVAVLTHQFTDSKEVLMFFNHLFIKGKCLSELGLLFYRKNTDFYIKTVPFYLFSENDLLRLGTDVSEKIINSVKFSHIKKLYLSLGPTSNYNIVIYTLKRIAAEKHYLFSDSIQISPTKVGRALSIIKIEDLTIELARKLNEDGIKLTSHLAAQIKDLSEYSYVVPLLSSTEGLTEQIIDKYIRETTDTDKILDFLKLSPVAEDLSRIEYWIDLSRKTSFDMSQLATVLYKNIPNIEDYLSVIIKELTPKIAMMTLNSIITEDVRKFAVFMRYPEYIELLRKSPLPLPLNLHEKIDIESIYNDYDETTPAPLFYLLSQSNIMPSSFIIPPLPPLDINDKEACAEELMIHRSPEGSNLIMIRAIANLSETILNYGQQIYGLTDQNKFAFLIFYFMKYNPHISFLELFSGNLKNVWEVLFNIDPNMDETDTKLFKIIIEMILIDTSIYSNMRVKFFIQMFFTQKILENNKYLRKIINHYLIRNFIRRNTYEIIVKLSTNLGDLSPKLKEIIIESNSNQFDNNQLSTELINYLNIAEVSNLTPLHLAASYRTNNDIIELLTGFKKGDYTHNELCISDILKYNTDKARELCSFANLKRILKPTNQIYFRDLLKLTEKLMNDKDTNVHHIQLMFRRYQNPLRMSLSENIFGYLLEYDKAAFAIAVDSHYQHSLVNERILIQRVNPIYVRPPSEYSINLVNELLEFCKEELSYNAFEILFAVSSSFLPVFKYTNMPIREIFSICTSTQYIQGKDRIPFEAALLFLNDFLEEPSYLDEFFSWVFENIDEFEPSEVLMVTSIILIKVYYQEISLVTSAELMKHKWFDVSNRLMQKTWGDLDKVIQKTVSDITLFWVNTLICFNSQDSAIFSSLVNTDNMFTASYGDLPIGHNYKYKPLSPFLLSILEESNTKTLFDNSTKYIQSSFICTSDLLEETPEAPIDYLPEMVSKEEFESLDKREQAVYLKNLVRSQKITKEFVSLAAKNEHWIMMVVNKEFNLLLSPLHYIKILQIFEESKKINEFNDDLNLASGTISRMIPSMFDDKQKDINTIIYDLRRINYKSILSEQKLQRIIDLSLIHNSELSVKNGENLYTILKNSIKHPIKQLKLLFELYYTKGSEYSSLCVMFYSILSEEQKESCRNMIENLYRAAIDTTNYKTLNLLINIEPQKAQPHMKDIILILYKLMERAEIENKVPDILASILSIMVENSVESDPITPKEENTESENSSVSIREHFWIVYEKVKPIIFNELENYPDLKNTKYKFIFDHIELIPIANRINILKCTLGFNKSFKLKMELHREKLFKETIRKLKNIPIIKFKGEFKINFVNEKGIDLGGVTRDWMTNFIKQAFLPENKLFKPLPSRVLYIPSGDCTDDALSSIRTVGKIIALAIIRNTPISAPLSKCIIKRIINQKPTEQDIITDLGEIYKNITSIRSADDCESLYLDFTWIITHDGKNEIIPLKEGGQDIMVTKDNVDEYCDLVIDYLIYGEYKQQIDALLDGFHEIIPEDIIQNHIKAGELETLINGVSEFDVEDFEKNVIITKPYFKHSKTIKHFFNIIRRWDNKKLSKLLLFITGLPSPPIEGFKNLKIKICITDNSLPKACICFKKFYIPDCRNEEVLEKKILIAIDFCDTFENA